MPGRVPGQDDQHLGTLLNIARAFQIIPLLRVLFPISCVLVPEMRRRNEDITQELALLQVSWQHIAYSNRQPYRLLHGAQLKDGTKPDSEGLPVHAGAALKVECKKKDNNITCQGKSCPDLLLWSKNRSSRCRGASTPPRGGEHGSGDKARPENLAGLLE